MKKRFTKKLYRHPHDYKVLIIIVYQTIVTKWNGTKRKKGQFHVEKKMYFSKRVIIINWKIWMTDSKNGIQTNLKAYTVRSKRVWALGPAGLDIDFICSFFSRASWPEILWSLHEINFHSAMYNFELSM